MLVCTLSAGRTAWHQPSSSSQAPSVAQPPQQACSPCSGLRLRSFPSLRLAACTSWTKMSFHTLCARHINRLDRPVLEAPDQLLTMRHTHALEVSAMARRCIAGHVIGCCQVCMALVGQCAPCIFPH